MEKESGLPVRRRPWFGSCAPKKTSCHEELVDLGKRLHPVAAETENLTLAEALQVLEQRTAQTISQLEQHDGASAP
jgi:hypothetical protein